MSVWLSGCYGKSRAMFLLIGFSFDHISSCWCVRGHYLLKGDWCSSFLFLSLEALMWLRSSCSNVGWCAVPGMLTVKASSEDHGVGRVSPGKEKLRGYVSSVFTVGLQVPLWIVLFHVWAHVSLSWNSDNRICNPMQNSFYRTGSNRRVIFMPRFCALGKC